MGYFHHPRSLILIFLISTTAFSELYNISYDIYFKGYFLGDALAQVNEYGELIAMDTGVVVRKLPALLKKFGVEDHPLQTTSYRPEMLPIRLWQHEYHFRLEVSEDDFVAVIHLPPQFQPIVPLSLQPQEKRNEPTVVAAKKSGWLFSTHRLNINETVKLFGTWRGSFSLGTWRLFANGSYGSESTFLENWRIERVFWGERHRRLQFGYIEPPLILNGQLLSSNTFGISFSNVFNRFMQTGLIEELPGGILELLEPSLVEFFDNGIPIKSIALQAGRYRLRDLFIADGIHQIDVRITAKSGRIVERRLRVETFASHPKSGTSEYSFYAGIRPKQHHSFTASAAFYRGFSDGLAAGLHFSVEQNKGYRFGAYLDQFFLEDSSLNLELWQQARTDSPITFFTETNLRAGFLPWDPNIRLAYAKHNGQKNITDRVWDATINFSTSLFETQLFELDFGWAQQVNGHSGVYGSLSRSWMLSDSMAITGTLNLNAINHQFNALISFSFNPDGFFQSGYNQSLGTNSNTTINLSAGQHDKGFRGNLNYTDTPDTRSLRAILEHSDTRFITRGQLDVTTEYAPNVGAFSMKKIQDRYLYFQSALLFADGNFGLSKEVNESFAIVNTRALKNSNRVKVHFTGKTIKPFLGTFSMGQLLPFRSNRIDIDPSLASMAYGFKQDFVYPEPGQGFVILLKPDLNLMAYGELRLPGGDPIKNAFGELHPMDGGERKEWFTGSDGNFMFEGTPGKWWGNVYWQERQYQLNLNLLESQSEEGTLNLGIIKLDEPSPLQIEPY